MADRHYHTLYFGSESASDVELLRYLFAIARHQRGRLLKEVLRLHLPAHFARALPEAVPLRVDMVRRELAKKPTPARTRARAAAPLADPASVAHASIPAPLADSPSTQGAASSGGRDVDLESGLGSWVR